MEIKSLTFDRRRFVMKSQQDRNRRSSGMSSHKFSVSRRSTARLSLSQQIYPVFLTRRSYAVKNK